MMMILLALLALNTANHCLAVDGFIWWYWLGIKKTTLIIS